MNLYSKFKQLFFRGLLALIPVVAILYLMYLIFKISDDFLGNFIKEHIVKYNIPGTGLLAGILLITLTGYLTSKKWTDKLKKIFENVINKIPLIDKVYAGIKQIVNAFTTKGKDAFSRVVLIKCSLIGVHLLGFETGYTDDGLKSKTGKQVISVFIPATPNPAVGNIVFVPKDQIIYLDMKIDTALKLIVSAGVSVN